MLSPRLGRYIFWKLKCVVFLNLPLWMSLFFAHFVDFVTEWADRLSLDEVDIWTNPENEVVIWTIQERDAVVQMSVLCHLVVYLDRTMVEYVEVYLLLAVVEVSSSSLNWNEVARSSTKKKENEKRIIWKENGRKQKLFSIIKSTLLLVEVIWYLFQVFCAKPFLFIKNH